MIKDPKTREELIEHFHKGQAQIKKLIDSLKQGLSIMALVATVKKTMQSEENNEDNISKNYESVGKPYTDSLAMLEQINFRTVNIANRFKTTLNQEI